MLRILAIDTATHACSVALLDNGELDQEISVSPREHTQRLLPMVDNLLAKNELTPQNLDAIAFSSGPGSFTGLRIGLSVAQGLAYGADLPLIPISTLEAMAFTALRQQSLAANSLIVPVIDARMNEVYWAAYRVTDTDLFVEQEAKVDTPSSCKEQLQVIGEKNFYGVGSGWHYADLFGEASDAKVDFYPEAASIALLAQTYLQNNSGVDAMAAQPVYLRNEIHWQKRKRIRTESI